MAMLVPVTDVSNWKWAAGAAAFSWSAALAYAWFASTQAARGSALIAALALPLIVAPFLLWADSFRCALAARALWWGQMLLGFMLMDSHRSVVSLGIGIAAGSAASLLAAGPRGLERRATDRGTPAFYPLSLLVTVLALGDVQVLLLASLFLLVNAELSSSLVAFGGALVVLATSLIALQGRRWKIGVAVACCASVLTLLGAELVEAHASVRALLMATSGLRAVMLLLPFCGSVAQARPPQRGSFRRDDGKAAPALLFVLLAAIAACWIVTFCSGQPEVIYSYDVHELLARHERGQALGAALRVTGTVVPGSIVRFGQPCQLSFRLGSRVLPDRELEVHHSSCDLSHTFHDNRPLELNVNGHLRPSFGRPCFEAQSIVVRMSKYEMIERH